MRTRSAILVLLLLLVCLSWQSRPITHVVMISIDGLSPDYYLRPQISLPNIQKLRAAGSWGRGVVTEYPPSTFPSHTSMVTGVRPDRHGIINNTIFDPLTGSRNWYLDAS